MIIIIIILLYYLHDYLHYMIITLHDYLQRNLPLIR